MREFLFEVEGLDVRFKTPDGDVHAVRNASLDIIEGECLGVVGESGSGKSQLFLAAMSLLASNGRAAGSVRYRGEEIFGATESRLNLLRGSKVTMIFQDPLTSLTPHMTIGAQLIEALRVHQHVPYIAAERRCLEILDLVRIADARSRMRQYPHELSGGMRQRVMIAMATLCGPDLLIADEPTTALDVTVQAQILEIMRDLKRELKTAVVMISHDMSVIAGIADRVAVMKNGEIVENGPVDDIFYKPQNEYTKKLLAAMPRIDRPASQPLRKSGTAPRTVLRVSDLRVQYRVRTQESRFGRRALLNAVDGVNLELHEGETLGIVGESGCGKSTLARAILKLVPAHAGRIAWLGRDLLALSAGGMRRQRKELQIVFQDPLASLDPRMTIGQSIAEPLKSLEPGLTRAAVTASVRDMMRRVGLDVSCINRYPHEFSGGQNQRVAIARAMIVRPRLLVCDEAVSGLDVSIQAQIVELILNLQTEFGMSMLFISHDFSVVRQVSHRVMVLFLGRVVELADVGAIYEDARHPYTRALIAAVPRPDPRAERAKTHILLTGDLPSPLDPKSALTFLKSKLSDGPEQYVPQLIEVTKGHFVAEHDPVEINPSIPIARVA
ncbi:MAG: ABC transporter ATP-binding protein [Rhizomicrobium sp.]|jgi:oligopeptide/dipeptide ABC transporter ATP-binding protein